MSLECHAFVSCDQDIDLTICRGGERGDFFDAMVDGKAALVGEADVFVGPFGLAFDTEDRITAVDQAAGDWVEVLLGYGIAEGG